VRNVACCADPNAMHYSELWDARHRQAMCKPLSSIASWAATGTALQDGPLRKPEPEEPWRSPNPEGEVHAIPPLDNLRRFENIDPFPGQVRGRL